MRRVPLMLLTCLAFASAGVQAQALQTDFAPLFDAQASRKLTLEAPVIAAYSESLTESLRSVKTDDFAEFYVMVDRNPKAQRLLLFVGTPSQLSFVGAAPVATGNVGRFDYYITPLGIFEKTLTVDFRAEGTRNEHGIKGYGSKGMRIWDFGWYPATKGWKPKSGETTDIRFQMHSTDPKLLEPKLGSPGSKGCIRIPESVNKFMDRYGVLDRAYDEAAATAAHRPWIWAKDHEANSFSGRYLVVVDSADAPVGQ
jgi:hypothetical protein